MPPMKATGTKIARKRQGGRKDGQADFLGAVDRGLKLVFVLLFDEAINILEHDNRVVDDDTDGKRQREAS